jgi:hypothetical protein
MKKILILAMVLCAVVMLTSCMASTRTMIKSAADIEPDKVIIVGKFVLHPELVQAEQSFGQILAGDMLSGVMDAALRNALVVLNGTDPKGIDLEKASQTMAVLMSPEWKDRIEAKFGETFYAVAENVPLYFYSGAIILKLFSQASGNTTYYTRSVVYLPMGYKIDIKPDDKAVYIGTVHLYRDEFNKLLKTEIIDDYKTEKELFTKTFGNIPLRKVTLTAMEAAK